MKTEITRIINNNNDIFVNPVGNLDLPPDEFSWYKINPTQTHFNHLNLNQQNGLFFVGGDGNAFKWMTISTMGNINVLGASSTMTVTNVFRIGQGCVIPQACSVTAIFGWITANSNNDLTYALCKVTPDPTSVSILQPVVVNEIN